MKFKIVFTAAFLAVMMLAPVVRAQNAPAPSEANAPAAAATSKAGKPMTMREKVAALRQVRISACDKKSAGDPCSFSRGAKNIEGKCQKGPHDNLLMCKPQPGPISVRRLPSGAPQP